MKKFITKCFAIFALKTAKDQKSPLFGRNVTTLKQFIDLNFLDFF